MRRRWSNRDATAEGEGCNSQRGRGDGLKGPSTASSSLGGADSSKSSGQSPLLNNLAVPNGRGSVQEPAWQDGTLTVGSCTNQSQAGGGLRAEAHTGMKS